MNQDINWFGGRRPDDRRDHYGRRPASQLNRRDQQQNPQQPKHRAPYQEYQGRSHEREYNHSGRPQKRDVQLPNVWAGGVSQAHRSQADQQLEVVLAGAHPPIRQLDHYRRHGDLEPDNLRDPRSRSLSRNGPESEQDDPRNLRSRSLPRYAPTGYGPVMYPMIPYVGYVPYGQVVSGYSLPTYGYSGHTPTGYDPTPYRQDQPIQNEVIVTKQDQMVEELIMINSDDEEPMQPQQIPPMPPRQRRPIPMQSLSTKPMKPPSSQPMKPPPTQPIQPSPIQFLQPPPTQLVQSVPIQLMQPSQTQSMQPPQASPIEPPSPRDQYQQQPCVQYLQSNYGMMVPPEQKGMMYSYPPPPVNWIPPATYYQYDPYRASAAEKPSVRKIMYNAKADDLLGHSKSLLDDSELLASIQSTAPKQKQTLMSNVCRHDQTPSTLFKNVNAQIPSTSSGFFQDSPSKWMYWDHEWSVCGRKPMCNCSKCPLPQVSFRPFSEQVPPLQADLTEADDADEKNFDRTLSAEASFLEVVRRLRIMFIRIVCPTRNIDNFIRDIEAITRLMTMHMYRANDPPSSSKFPEEGGSMHVMFYIFKLIQQIAFVLPYMGMERHSKVLDFYAAICKLFLALLTFANHLMVNETNRKANFNSKVLAALILFPIIKCFHFRFDMMAHLLYDAPVDFRAKEQKGDEWQEENEDKDPPPSLMAMFWRHIFIYMFEENYWFDDPPYDEMLVLRLYVLMQKWLNYDGDHSVTCEYFKKFQKRFGTVRTLGRRFKSIGEILANRNARRRRGIAWGGDTPAMVRDYHRIRRNEEKKIVYFNRPVRCGQQMTSNQDKPESEQITHTISQELQGSTAEYYSELTSYVESPKQRRLRKGKFIPGKPHLCKGKMLPNPPVTDSMIEGQSADVEFLFSPTRLRGLSEPDLSTSSLSIYFPSITRPPTSSQPYCDPSTPLQSINNCCSEKESPPHDEIDDMFPQSAEAFIEFICLEILIPIRDPQEDAKANAKKMDVPIVERIPRPPSVIIEAIPYQQIEPFVFPIEPMEIPVGSRQAPQFEKDGVVFVKEIEAVEASTVVVDTPGEAEIQGMRSVTTEETLSRPVATIIPFEGVHRPVEAIKPIPGIVEMPVEPVGASSPTNSTGISTKQGETQSDEVVESSSAGSALLKPVRTRVPEDSISVKAAHSPVDSVSQRLFSSTWAHPCHKLVHQRVCSVSVDTETTQTRSSEDRVSNELASPAESRVPTESKQIVVQEGNSIDQPINSSGNRLSAKSINSRKRPEKMLTILKQACIPKDKVSNAVGMTRRQAVDMTSAEYSESSPIQLNNSQETEPRQVPLLENSSRESASRNAVLVKLRRFESTPGHLREKLPGQQLLRSPCGWRHGERTQQEKRFSRPVRRYSRREISWRAARAITFKYSRMCIPPRAQFFEVDRSENAELTGKEGQLQDRPIRWASVGILDKFERSVSEVSSKVKRELQRIPGSSFMYRKSKSRKRKELKGSRISSMEKETEIGTTLLKGTNSFKEETEQTNAGKNMSDSSMKNIGSNEGRRKSGAAEIQASYNIKKMHVNRFLVDEIISSSDDALRKDSPRASRYKSSGAVEEIFKSVETAVSTSNFSRDPLSRMQELLAQRMHNNTSANAQDRTKSRFKDEQLEQDLVVSNSDSLRKSPYALQKIGLSRCAESSSSQEQDLTMCSSSKQTNNSNKNSGQRRAASGPSGNRSSPSPSDQDLTLSSKSNFPKLPVDASSRSLKLWNESETMQQTSQMSKIEAEPANEERTSLAYNNVFELTCSEKPSSTELKMKRGRIKTKKAPSQSKPIISNETSTSEIPAEKYPGKKGNGKPRNGSESPDVVSTSKYSIRDDLKPTIKIISTRSSRSGRKSISEEVASEGQIPVKEDFIVVEAVSVSSSQVNQGRGLIVSLPRKDLVIPRISQSSREGRLKQGRESDSDTGDMLSDQDNILPCEDSNDEKVSCVERAPQISEESLKSKKIFKERSLQSTGTVNVKENGTEPFSDDGRENSEPSHNPNPLSYETLDRKEVQCYFSKCKQFIRNGSGDFDSMSFSTSTSPLVTSSISLSSTEISCENLVDLRDPRLSGNSQCAKLYQHSCERKNVAVQENTTRTKPKKHLSCQDFYNSFGRQMSVDIVEGQDQDPIGPSLIESASSAEIENSIIVQCRFMHFVKEEPPEEVEEANREDILSRPQWSLEKQNCVSAVSYKLQAMSLSGFKPCGPQILKSNVDSEKVAALMDFNRAEIVPEVGMTAQKPSPEAPSSVLRLSGPQNIPQTSAKKTYSVTFCEQKMDEIYAREFGERNAVLSKRGAFPDQSAYTRPETPALGLKPVHAITEISVPFQEPRNLWDETRSGTINVKSDAQLQQSTQLVLKRPTHKSDNNNEVSNGQFESFRQSDPGLRNSNLGKLVIKLKRTDIPESLIRDHQEEMRRQRDLHSFKLKRWKREQEMAAAHERAIARAREMEAKERQLNQKTGSICCIFDNRTENFHKPSNALRKTRFEGETDDQIHRNHRGKEKLLQKRKFDDHHSEVQSKRARTTSKEESELLIPISSISSKSNVLPFDDDRDIFSENRRHRSRPKTLDFLDIAKRREKSVLNF